VIAALKIVCVLVLSAVWTFLAVKGATEERYPQLETIVAVAFFGGGCEFVLKYSKNCVCSVVNRIVGFRGNRRCRLEGTQGRGSPFSGRKGWGYTFFSLGERKYFQF
jgi:hypothetical protein